MARAVGVSLPISQKQATEICNYLRHRKLSVAKKFLDEVLEMKRAIPYMRYNQNVAHKAGMAGGRYPQNASKEILKLLNSVEANANNKGITNDLYITHMNAHRAPPGQRAGRVPGESKRAHVEVVIEEKKVEKKKYTGKKSK